MTNHAHIQYLVDNFADIGEEIRARSPGWFRGGCERCGWYTTGTENYMDEWAWNHMRDFHVGKIRITKCAGKDLPAGARVRTVFGYNNPSTWWAITPNGIAHSFGPHDLVFGLAMSWLHNFGDDVDFWDPMCDPSPDRYAAREAVR